MKIEPKRTLKRDPKNMPKPSKGGQGPPQGAPGGDFDSFWSASRTFRDQKKGVRKMDRKRDPQNNDFWRLVRRDRADPGRGLAECADGIWLLNSKKFNSYLARRAPRMGAADSIAPRTPPGQGRGISTKK